MRMGDFYEAFGDDAINAANALDLTVTSRGDFPMAGFPCHYLDRYVANLVALGYRVAVCEPV